jgi:outer membrane lipoprotein-sorting protein
MFLALISTSVLSQQNAPPQPPPASETTVPGKAESVTPASNDAALMKVLQRMDQTARTFRALEANFVWKMYNSVVNDFAETDTGRIYFRRNGNDVEMAAEIMQPARKKVVFSGGKIQIAEPNGEIDVYDASAHREEFEAFLVLGFGSSSEEIRKSFGVKYVSHEKMGSVEIDKIELTPISQKIKERFPRIDLWIDPSGLSKRQQLFQADEDYRLADYSDFKLNQKISDGVFKLKQSPNTKIIRH